MLITWLGVLAIGFFIRWLPMLGSHSNTGVDHWFWHAYTQTVHRDSTFPPVLPNYIFDKGQWYPPLFPIVLSRLPARFMEGQSHWVAMSIDMGRLAFLLLSIKLLGYRNLWIYGVAGLIYATAPMAALYNVQLNPRGLGAMFMDALLMLVVLRAGIYDGLGFWVSAILLASLILLTHKMTTQIFVAVLVSLAVTFQAWKLLLLLPAAVIGAMLLSGGFYFKVLRAHGDIVKFWSREWPLLGADPLRESPLYGRPGYQGPVRQYAPGFGNVVKRILSFFGGNYVPAMAGALLLTSLVRFQEPAMHWITAWFLSALCFALATVLIPALRGFGFGNLYLYNAVFPGAIIMGVSCVKRPTISFTIVLVSLLYTVITLVRSYKYQRGSKSLTVPDSVLSEVASCSTGAWMCFPFQLMEHVACLANKRVLWGGHGYGFNELRQVFPVIRTDFRDLIKRYNLRFILVQNSYLPDVERIPLSKKVLFQTDGFHIFEFVSEDSSEQPPSRS